MTYIKCIQAYYYVLLVLLPRRQVLQTSKVWSNLNEVCKQADSGFSTDACAVTASTNVGFPLSSCTVRLSLYCRLTCKLVQACGQHK